MNYENLIDEIYDYTRRILDEFGVYGKTEGLLESREEHLCYLAQEEASRITKNAGPSRPKLNLIALTEAAHCPGGEEPIVMVNVQSICTITEWEPFGSKLTFTSGEHLLVKEKQDTILDMIDE